MRTDTELNPPWAADCARAGTGSFRVCGAGVFQYQYARCAAAGVCAAYGAEEPFCSGTSCGYVCCRYAVCDEYPGEKTQEFHTGSPGRRCCPGNLKNLSYFLVFNNDDQKPKCITEYCR